jgi:opacity protein-like surface antigen
LQTQSNISVNNGVDYLGTVRGRLGVLVTPALLVYGDGGFAYGGVHEGVDVVSTLPPSGGGLSPAFGSFTNTRPGWTAGGGLEWMVSPNWSVKAEYLYYDLGKVTFGVGGLTQTLFPAGPALFTDLPVASTRFDGHIVRVGLNYHFDRWNPGPVAAMALTAAADAADLPTGASPVYLPPPPVFTWTGFYAGLNAGYTFGGSNSVDVETMSGVATSEQSAADAVATSATDVLSLRNPDLSAAVRSAITFSSLTPGSSASKPTYRARVPEARPA